MNVSASPARANARAIVALVAVVLLAFVALSSLSYLLFIAVALVPAAALAALERQGQRQATISVGSLTAATVAPLVIGAIAGGSRRDLLASAEAWAFVGTAAVAGFAIYLALPAVAVWIADLRADTRLRKLRERQQALEKDWGPEIRAPSDQ
jgi:hypothetical protein